MCGKCREMFHSWSPIPPTCQEYIPLVETDHEPPTHTVIIEANIHATGTSGKKITRSMRHRIIQSCGDSGLRRGTSTCIDPALCLYTGCRVMCILDNVGLTESVPRGNGTVCTVVGMKLKEQCDSFKWKKGLDCQCKGC